MSDNLNNGLWQPTPQIGLIGYFDILGYQTFLEKNSIDYVVKTSIKKLIDLKLLMPGQLFKFWSPLVNERETANAVLKCGTEDMRWLVFSDTVLLTLPIPGCADIEKLAYFSLFLTQCAILWEEMFEEGFPLRGVVDYGEFIVYEGSFAGKPIIEAYKLASKLNFAGSVMSSAATAWAEKLLQNENLQGEPAYIDYAIPFNGKVAANETLEQSLKGLNVLLHKTPSDLMTLDYAKWVQNSFVAHGKELDEKGRQKMENTVEYLSLLRDVQRNSKGFFTRKKSP